MQQRFWRLRAPCAREDAEALSGELGISATTASVLVRRGYADVRAAEAFLAAELPGHDPSRLGDMAEACESIRDAVSEGTPICVHGDYDADGICATALAVLVLRELGAEVSWHLPSRFDEGYGVNGQTLTRLAGEGVGLVLTVDCGVTAVAEVATARGLGLDVVVTDHHRAGPELPSCPVVGPYRGGHPFGDLCGTGVVWKLGQALLGADSEALARHLDLVAVATVADVVPLVDENRGLVVAGLRQLARTQKPGLRELMRVARVDPAAVDAGAIGFRLAPRLNAAGRLGRPEAALELLLAEEREVAAPLAAQLEELNRDRQAVEERILREATEAIEEWPEARRRRRAYVVAAEDWHEGVIGIVASRLVERYRRPVVLIAGTDGDWKGSGRSIVRFDLHDGLRECAGDLQRWGGHAAAAGLSIRPERVDAFAEAFAAVADERLSEDDLRPVATVDALVHGGELTLDLCAELARLAPFGLGNPNVTLLLAGCEVVEPATVGEGKHLRFRVRADGRDSGSAIAFRFGPQLDRLRRVGHYDVAFKLEANQWNGTVAPQLNVRQVFDADERYVELREWLKLEWRKPPEQRDSTAVAVFAELALAGTGPKRHLLESERFAALLAGPDLARAA
jgi:single-stranded-DNA-specific exonuclease